LPFRRAPTVAAVAAAIVLISVVAVVPITTDRARQVVITALSDRFDSTVDLESFDLRVLPGLRAEGSGLTLRHKGRRDVPPLVSIRRFVVTVSVLGLLRGHARLMTVEGLEVAIPPGRPEDHDANADKRKDPFIVRWLVIDELTSTDARVSVIPRESGHRARVWSVHHLRMQTIGDRSMPFEAQLTNAVPPGEIASTGNFGPWNREDPRQTPLDGSFALERADLSVFKGISGILSSRGRFGGVLARIDVQGETDTPEFVVSLAGQPVPLHARYSATVDGTNGDTILDRIDGSFLGTALVAKGRVVDAPGAEGRTVALDVTIDQGRIEDVLRLAVKAARPMIGALTLQTKLVLPPGDRDVIEKLRLDGHFTLARARFTNIDVSRKINELSQRGRGQKTSAQSPQVSSDFAGRFTLKGGRLNLPAVSFDVPGAAVRLAGSYDLRGEDVDFRGALFTDVKVSQLTNGMKSFLLKMIDPLFTRNAGGSSIPIKVTGSLSAPSFGLDTGRILSRGGKKTAQAVQ